MKKKYVVWGVVGCAALTVVCMVIGVAVVIWVANRYAGGLSDSVDFEGTIDNKNAYRDEDRPVDFDLFYTADEVDGVKLSVDQLGELAVRSGYLVVSDPMYVSESFTHPLKQKIGSGRYPVFVSTAHLSDWGDRVAFLKLQLTDEEAVAWELAEPAIIEDNDVSIWVDSGTLGIMDVDTSALFIQREKEYYEENPDGYFYQEYQLDSQGNFLDVLEFFPSRQSELNMFVVSSGLGDGSYYAYWGRDDEGRLCSLVVDFQLFDSTGSLLE